MKTHSGMQTLCDGPLLLHQGKTRNTYRAQHMPGGPPCRLIVATDRLSTHNVVHMSTIPNKGEVLSALTVYLMTEVIAPSGIPHHILAFGKRIREYYEPGTIYPSDMVNNGIVVQSLDMIPVEFIWRAYNAGSLYAKYTWKGTENPYGLSFKGVMPKMYRFESPVFTPTDKSDTDDPLKSADVESAHEEATRLSRKAFGAIREKLNRAGIEAVDGKFELGVAMNGKVTLADEISPDSMRFCDLAAIREGKEPAWRDKQRARDEAERMWRDGEKRPLIFSDEIRMRLTDTYLQIFHQIAGQSLGEFQKNYY
jgi:phosphoribosylaminoimidazole-succinocarboxamide synthase